MSLCGDTRKARSEERAFFNVLNYCMVAVQEVPPAGSYIIGFIWNEQNPRMPLLPGLVGVPTTV